MGVVRGASLVLPIMRRTLGVLFFAGPFVAAAVAAASARRDLRLAVMAVVATLSARLVLHTDTASVTRTIVAFALAFGTGAGAALISGARAPFGVIAVAAVVAAFATTGQLLLRGAAKRPNSPHPVHPQER